MARAAATVRDGQMRPGIWGDQACYASGGAGLHYLAAATRLNAGTYANLKRSGYGGEYISSSTCRMAYTEQERDMIVEDDRRGECRILEAYARCHAGAQNP